MPLKRLCAALLCAALLLGCAPAAALAADAGGVTVTDEKDVSLTVYEEYIQVKQDDAVSAERVLCDDAGVVYVPTGFVEKYTQYTYYPKERTFREYDGSDPGRRFAKAVTIPKGQGIAFLRAYPQPLEHVFTWDGELWVPAHQFLPLLEMYCEVEDGVFVLEVAGPSVADTFYGFDDGDVCFDPAVEFDGNAALEIVSVTSAMWFDTFANFRLDRAIGLGNYEDYRTAAMDYVTDRDGYQAYIEKMQSDAAAAEETINDIAGAKKTAQEIKKVVDVPMGLLKFWHDALELQDKLDGEGTWEVDQYFYKIIPKGAYDLITGASDTVGYVLQGLDIAMDYALMVQDNVDMIAAVYPEVKEPSNGDLKTAALQSVYASFSDIAAGNVMIDVLSEVSVEAFQDTLVDSALSLGGLTTAQAVLAKVEGKVADWFFSKASNVGAADDMALLNHHIILTSEARTAYKNAFTFSGVPYTGENIERLRLCALMMLTGSKRCYEILRDNNQYNDEYGSYCDARIANIEEYIVRMYELRYIQMYDGIEYFQKAPDMFLQLLQQAEKTKPQQSAPMQQPEQTQQATQTQQSVQTQQSAFRLKEKTQIGAVMYEAQEEYKTYYTYDGNGLLVQEDEYVVSGGMQSLYNTVTYTNDSQGRVVKTYDSFDNRTEYRYAAGGMKAQEIERNGAVVNMSAEDVAAYGLSVYTVRDYYYGEGQRLSKMIVWSAGPEDEPDFLYDESRAEAWIDYTYDADGNLLRDTFTSIYGEPVTTCYDSHGEKISDDYGFTYVNQYDEYGNLIRQTQMTDGAYGSEVYLDTYYLYESADGQITSGGESGAGTAPEAGAQTGPADVGTLALADCLNMSYGQLSSLAWDDCNFTDSFDAPGQWVGICDWNGRSYTFTFSGDQPGQPDAYPVTVSVFDTEYAGVKVMDGIYTGMTYGELRGLTELPVPVYDEGYVEFFSFAHSSFQTGDGRVVTLYFMGNDDAAMLAAADVAFAVSG